MAIDNIADKIRAARELREHLLSDPHRPGYHFAIPEDVGPPGDPNGAFYADERYHLMYLYDRRGVDGWKGKGYAWGHVSSADLVHWRHHPDALLPDDCDGGIFSGGAFLDDDGTAYLTYWRVNGVNEGIGIARSSDRHYERWEKLRVASLDGTEFGIRAATDAGGETRHLCNADPSNIWKDRGTYYLQAGNLLVLNKFGRDEHSPAHYRGDWVDLFRSRDLREWEYVHRFYERRRDNSWTQESEDDMCPSFLPLPRSRDGGAAGGKPGGKPGGKHLQLFISHNMGCQYYVGTYDRERSRFLPEAHGRMSWVDNTFFAPEALIDGSGRQIMWAWLTDNPAQGIEDALRDGWCGVYGLPRVLWLGDDERTLHMAPVPELECLRGRPKKFADVTVADGAAVPLAGFDGLSCEICVRIAPGSAQQAGLRVRPSPDGSETTLLYYDAATRQLRFDATRSGTRGRPVLERAPLELAAGETLQLRVFIDKSVIEVFANDRQAITRRVYPDGEASDGVALFARGGSAVCSAVRTWEMAPSNAC